MGRAFRREDIAQLVAEHLLDDLLAAQIVHWAAFNQLSVAQYRQGVADSLQLMNTVGDEHHADPLLLQTAYHCKQALTFMLIQRRGGFIQN